jgi:N utilization substance protein B
MRDKDVFKPVPRTVEKAAVKKNEGSANAQKTSARLAAVQVLYQMRLNNQDAQSAVREFIKHRVGFNIDGDVLVPADPDMLESIVMGVHGRWTDVEEIVAGALAAGRKGAVETLLDAVLRCGTWELLENASADTGVIINDYMNVTTSFYDGTETKLVNAVLDKIAKTVRG